MVIGSGAFGRWLGHEGSALMREFHVLIKDSWKTTLIPSAMWEYTKEMAVCELKSELSLDSKSAGALIWTSQAPDTREINFCCL